MIYEWNVYSKLSDAYLLIPRVILYNLSSSFLIRFIYILGAVASGKVEAINTDADRRLLHGQRLRDVKKANRRVAIPQSQDDNESGEDTTAKLVETKTIRQEHVVEPDSGVLRSDHERDLKSKSGKSTKSFKSSKKSRGPPACESEYAAGSVPQVNNNGGGTCDVDCACRPCKCIWMFCFSELLFCISNSLSNFVFALCILKSS